MKAPLRFYKSGLPNHINADQTGEQNTGDTAGLLKWISDVTIKRRQIRRSTRCSNLLAEAILSNALRKAKKDLAHKQEEKRNRIRLFCLSRGRSSLADSSESSDFELVKNPFSQKSKPPTIVANSNSGIANGKPYQLNVILKDLSSCNNSNVEEVSDSQQDRKMMTDSEADDEVKSCLSSLESFFKELKSVKVKS